MPDKSPELWGVATWLLALASSLAGGMLNFIGAAKKSAPLKIRIRDALIELATSLVVGMLVFMGLSGFGWDSGVCAAFSGAASHYSARLLYYIAHYADAYFEHKHAGLHTKKGAKDEAD